MSTTTFDQARFRAQSPRMTVVTDGLLVNGEVKHKDLQSAFSLDDLATMNTAYAQIFSATDRYYGKPLVGMTEAKGKLKEIDRQGFRWELSGGNFQRARITQVVCVDPKPGLNLQPFDIVVDKPYFSISDIIIPADNDYRLVVQPYLGSNGTYSRVNRQVGANAFRYTVRLITDNPNMYLPARFLAVEQEWQKVSSVVADNDNIDGGGFQFYSVFESQGQVQQHSVKYAIDDKTARKAKQAALRGDFNDDQFGKYLKMLWVKLEGTGKLQGQDLNKFMSLLESEAFNTLYQNVENTLMFGKQSTTLLSPEGHRMLTSSGLREQLESGWILTHNGNLSLEQMEDWFDSIMKDKISEGEQKIVLSAGREFRKMFDRMIKLDSRSFLTMDTTFIRKGSDFRHLDYGSYFAHYTGFTIDISVMENPAYDNSFFCPKMHPVRTNVPVDSWRADILDFGYSKQQGTGTTTDNISMVAETFCDYNITYNGKWYGAYDGKSGMPITDGGLGTGGNVSGYSRHIEKSAGLMVVDPTRCGSIYLSNYIV